MRYYMYMFQYGFFVVTKTLVTGSLSLRTFGCGMLSLSQYINYNVIVNVQLMYSTLTITL